LAVYKKLNEAFLQKLVDANADVNDASVTVSRYALGEPE
jgi:hypothetical protein